MVSFKMFAGTNVGLRSNNEDNFTVCPDLTKDEWIVPADNQQVVQLGQRGCVMIVADGMGGQNAGEVASAIAIETVQELFSPTSLHANILDKSESIKTFLKKVVSECDIRIKKRAEEDSSTFGMGSTIVIAWVVNSKLYVAWLGDSRAYSIVPGKGIARLSKDHSYVQQLVDAGKITEDEAMNHPNSNIITRSLGDTSQKAKADADEYDIEDGQVILLCSDGLCGVCRDDVIDEIVEDGVSDLQKCKEDLTMAALEAGGSDNITISLLQLFVAPKSSMDQQNEQKATNNKKTFPSFFPLIALGAALLLALVYAGIKILSTRETEEVPMYEISLKADKTTLSSSDETKYHVFLKGDNASFDIIYDKELLSLNKKDSLIRVKAVGPEDVKTYIKVICKQDKRVMDSLCLTIKKTEIEVDLSGLEGAIDIPVENQKQAEIVSPEGQAEDLESKLSPSNTTRWSSPTPNDTTSN